MPSNPKSKPTRVKKPMSVAHARLVLQDHLHVPEVQEALGGRFGSIWESPTELRKFCKEFLGGVPKGLRTLWAKKGSWVRGIGSRNEGAVGYIERVCFSPSMYYIRTLSPSPPKIWLEIHIDKNWEPCEAGFFNATRYDLMMEGIE